MHASPYLPYWKSERSVGWTRGCGAGNAYLVASSIVFDALSHLEAAGNAGASIPGWARATLHPAGEILALDDGIAAAVVHRALVDVLADLAHIQAQVPRRTLPA